MSAEIPEQPPPLLPGRSSLSWSRLFLKAAAVAAPAVLLMPPASGLGGPARDDLLTLLLVVGVSAAVVGLIASIGMSQMDAAEHRAGYTTSYGKWFSLWQLDPKTGEVLRRPGERTVQRRARRGQPG